MAEGWGSYSQVIDNQQLKAKIELSWGNLSLQTLRVHPRGLDVKQVAVTHNRKEVKAMLGMVEGTAVTQFNSPVTVQANQELSVILSK